MAFYYQSLRKIKCDDKENGYTNVRYIGEVLREHYMIVDRMMPYA